MKPCHTHPDELFDWVKADKQGAKFSLHTILHTASQSGELPHDRPLQIEAVPVD